MRHKAESLPKIGLPAILRAYDCVVRCYMQGLRMVEELSLMCGGSWRRIFIFASFEVSRVESIRLSVKSSYRRVHSSMLRCLPSADSPREAWGHCWSVVSNMSFVLDEILPMILYSSSLFIHSLLVHRPFPLLSSSASWKQ